jgi:hypothetical protein
MQKSQEMGTHEVIENEQLSVIKKQSNLQIEEGDLERADQAEDTKVKNKPLSEARQHLIRRRNHSRTGSSMTSD